MKNIIEFLNSSINEAKVDLTIPAFNDDMKVAKKYIKTLSDTPKVFKKDYLEKFFAYINMWLDKNISKIAKSVGNGDFPDSINVEMEDDVDAYLLLNADTYWKDDKWHGTLSDVEFKLSDTIPANMSNATFRQTQEDLKLFKLNNDIEF